MPIQSLPHNKRAAAIHRSIERAVNAAVRGIDRVRGRAANYDDGRYEFVGGESHDLRTKHYDKSLRLLWRGNAPLHGRRSATAAPPNATWGTWQRKG